MIQGRGINRRPYNERLCPTCNVLGDFIVCLNVRTHVTHDMCYPAITLLGQICLNSPLCYLLKNHLWFLVLESIFSYTHTHTQNCITLLHHCSRFICHHAILRVQHALVFICLYVCTQIVNLLLKKLTYLLTCNCWASQVCWAYIYKFAR